MCGNLIVSKGSLYVYLFELNLRNLLYVIDINIKGSNVASEAGKADLIAENNINIANATEYHERLHEEHNKVSGLLSSKTTDIYDYSNVNGVVSSNVSAGSIDIQSGKDTNVKGSNVVADNDVSVKTGGNLNIGSVEQTSESEYRIH